MRNHERADRVEKHDTTSRSTMDSEPVTVYWRPGCAFCASLFMRLERAGIPFEDVNIWENPDGRTFVRSVARGNETVPTVTVGKTTLVNPSIDEIENAMAGMTAGGWRSQRRSR